MQRTSNWSALMNHLIGYAFEMENFVANSSLCAYQTRVNRAVNISEISRVLRIGNPNTGGSLDPQDMRQTKKPYGEKLLSFDFI